MSDNIEERLKHVIVEHLEVDEKLIKPEAKLMEEVGLDSLDAIELLLAINEEFRTNIPSEDLEKINTVQDLTDAVKAQLQSS